MKEYVRYALGVIAVIAIIIMFVFGFNLLRKVAQQSTKNRSQGSSRQSSTDKALKSNDFINQPVVYTVRGAISGNEQHNSIRITVTPQVRRVEVLRGYTNDVIKTQETANTQAAYDAFIAAIQGAGFTNKRDNTQVQQQTCPLGRQFIFQVAPNNTTNHLTWATSCSSKDGTFNGNRSTIEQLFRRQIPNYGSFTDGVRLT